MSEAELAKGLAAVPFVISPTGTGDAEDDRTFILPGSASLPASPTCLPFIAFRSLSSVPGRAARHGSSRRLGVGLHCGYSREEFEKAALQLCEAEFNARCRRNCQQHATALRRR